MPAAIDLYCSVAIAPRRDRELHVYSAQFAEKFVCDLEPPSRSPRGDWSDYVIGTAIALENSGRRLRGANLVVSGDVPLGSGLSSSAAIEVSTGAALLNVSGHTIDRMQLALACQRAENEFVGARCGIMDQFISAHGQTGHALMLDCRSLEATALPIPADLRLLVSNTGVKHQHAAGEYNARRRQCEEGVRLLSSALPDLQSLRDVGAAQLEQHKHLLPDLIYKRCQMWSRKMNACCKWRTRLPTEISHPSGNSWPTPTAACAMTTTSVAQNSTPWSRSPLDFPA
jgi:galactokinase